ncbi:DUF1801 domain-containing protein [Paucibacter sp. DJ1R-11]|uniref:DUF1801 domain-containing protein n=1 Tax=Paucibacter sp. DJ1R-11 TaxID=2893556 RepID=UPI0021E51007|nr:DUF1801 domain-containing protein [Paucibacter sp. DJ1R-11]MCV2365771.1 DUF1801 domain-containing protein [Paucibacter sp. DJ1R-11]
MTENKTQATQAEPADYLETIADTARRTDCQALNELMRRATGEPPVMWGSAIVGFGLHRYPLAGGKTGEICAVGFSSRAADIALYGLTGFDEAEPLLETLGKHKRGKGCVYLKRLADVDAGVLEQLVTQAFNSKKV